MSRCIGCGTKIQTSFVDKPGYLPEIALIEHGEKVYCKRCYDIRHHNTLYTPDYDTSKYYEKISIIKEEKALVVLMIDVMDIFGGFIPELHKYIGNNLVLLLLNKVDILPKSIKIQKLEQLVLNQAKKEKLNVHSLMMISAKKQNDVEKVIAKISKIKYLPKKKYSKVVETRFDNCFIIGCASVGKSTFMNTIGRITLNYPDDVITTSNQYQTTQDFIKWPLDSKSSLIDTPGIVNSAHYGSYLNNKSLQVIIPKTYLKVRTFQLKDDQTIFLGNLAKISFISGSTNASFFVSNDLYLHRTKTIKADELENSQKFKLLVPPYTTEEEDLLKVKKTYKFEISSPTDIFISGIGFIHLTGVESIVEVSVPTNIKVVCKESFM